MSMISMEKKKNKTVKNKGNRSSAIEKKGKSRDQRPR